jgi:predicted O-methyltransferase YrrM
MTELCEIARYFGTDKGPCGHNYTPYYHELFQSRREQIHKVLEIGIDRGYSLFTWRAYFPNADILAIDSNPERMVNLERIRSFVADQGDEASLRRATQWAGTFIDFICDDGSHQPAHQILTAQILLPLLAPSGVYVIEDVDHADQITPHFPNCEVKEFDLMRAHNDRLVVIHA